MICIQVSSLRLGKTIIILSSSEEGDILSSRVTIICAL